MVSDSSTLTNSAYFIVNVESVNDHPVFENLPDTLSFRSDSSVVLELWEFTNDIETVDSLLQFEFKAIYDLPIASDSLFWDFNHKTGRLALKSVNYIGLINFILSATDNSFATTMDTIVVYVLPPTLVEDANEQLPTQFKLYQNYPNPFNPNTLICYDLPKSSNVIVEIYNLNGQKIKTLFNGRKEAGRHHIQFNSEDANGMIFPSGIYFYIIRAGDFKEVKKFTLIK